MFAKPRAAQDVRLVAVASREERPIKEEPVTMTLEPGEMEILAGLVASKVRDINSVTDEWMSKEAIQEHTGYGSTKTSQALNGAPDELPLHCHRPTPRAAPRVRRSVVDAWMSGASLEQQRQVCGCARYHRWDDKT